MRANQQRSEEPPVNEANWDKNHHVALGRE